VPDGEVNTGQRWSSSVTKHLARQDYDEQLRRSQAVYANPIEAPSKLITSGRHKETGPVGVRVKREFRAVTQGFGA
jgi:hypothetical protein